MLLIVKKQTTCSGAKCMQCLACADALYHLPCTNGSSCVPLCTACPTWDNWALPPSTMSSSDNLCKHTGVIRSVQGEFEQRLQH